MGVGVGVRVVRVRVRVRVGVGARLRLRLRLQGQVTQKAARPHALEAAVEVMVGSDCGSARDVGSRFGKRRRLGWWQRLLGVGGRAGGAGAGRLGLAAQVVGWRRQPRCVARGRVVGCTHHNSNGLLRTVCFLCSRIGRAKTVAERSRNSPRGCRVTASRLQGRKRLFGGKLHNQQVGEEAALRRSTMTPTRRRVVGASGKGAMLNSTRAVAPARAAWSRWTAQCLGGPTTSLRMS